MCGTLIPFPLGCALLGQNEAAKTIICQVCRQTFLCTTRLAAVSREVALLLRSVAGTFSPDDDPKVQEHVTNKHSGKTVDNCFPGFKEIPK